MIRIDRSLESLQLPGQPQWEELRPFPVLDNAARHGLAGEILSAIEHDTEAHPAAILLTLLCAFGNVIGPQSRTMVGDDEHPVRLFVALVGPTSSGAKGTSLAAVRPFLRAADREWWDSSRQNGFASGEAIIAKLGGYLQHDKDAMSEKRAFVIEPEFARLLTVNGRDGSTASPVLRGAWDEGRMQLIRAKQELFASETHVSLLAHITPDELRARLLATDISGGFANRFLFACVRRERSIPSPRQIDGALIETFGRRLHEAINHGQASRIVARTPKAEALWASLYDAEPDRDGVIGSITARSAPQRLRLSLAFALLDRSDTICEAHVRAAQAVWRYCSNSVDHIFGDAASTSVEARLLEFIRNAHPEGRTQTSQSDYFGRHVPARDLDAARASLLRRGLIRIKERESQGRTTRVAFACEKGELSERRGGAIGVSSHNSHNSQHNIELRIEPEVSLP